jgi:hypothetical protein
MVADAGLALVKLVLGLGVFVALGYLGKFYDKRLAGVLLTFPILNSIGIVTGDDALAVADAVYAVVVLNGLILFFMIGFCERLTPMAGASDNVKLVARVAVWAAIWAVCAPLVINFRDNLPDIAGILALQIVLATLAVVVVWAPPHTAANAGAPRLSLSGHVQALVELWSNTSGIVRMGLFVLCCMLLFAVAQFGTSKWIGMFSAVPLPGLFAIATLSVLNAQEDVKLMRDTVLIGALGVNIFNWLFAHLYIRLPFDGTAHTVAGIVMLVGMMAIDAVLLFWLTPRISAVLDRVRA